MAQKAEIQYVSQFSGCGSDDKPKKKRREKEFLPQQKEQKLHKVPVDLVALLGILSAVLLLCALIFGGFHLNRMWKEHTQMKEYLGQLKSRNATLQHEYNSTVKIDDVKTMADSIGLVPESESEVRYVRVTPPEPRPKETWKDDLQWFLDGLFGEIPEGAEIPTEPE